MKKVATRPEIVIQPMLDMPPKSGNLVVVETLPSTQVKPGWTWRSREGRLRPKTMVTRHLFHTFRMIWNNTMPKEAWVGEVRLYNFGPSHSDGYLAEAIVNIGAELFQRTDIDPRWKRELDEMARWFAKYRIGETVKIGGGDA